MSTTNCLQQKLSTTKIVYNKNCLQQKIIIPKRKKKKKEEKKTSPTKKVS